MSRIQNEGGIWAGSWGVARREKEIAWVKAKRGRRACVTSLEGRVEQQVCTLQNLVGISANQVERMAWVRLETMLLTKQRAWNDLCKTRGSCSFFEAYLFERERIYKRQGREWGK